MIIGHINTGDEVEKDRNVSHHGAVVLDPGGSFGVICAQRHFDGWNHRTDPL